jgi:hypothetical protein
MTSGTDFSTHFQRNVTEAFRVLLSEKHLYQSVKVDTAYIDEVAKVQHSQAQSEQAQRLSSAMTLGLRSPIPDWKSFRKEGVEMYSKLWIPDAGISYPQGSLQAIAGRGHVENCVVFRLPTVRTRCPHCKGRWPFNPMEADRAWEKGRTLESDQWLFLSYECQNCKGEPIRFLVRRASEKLTLCGRDPMESVDVPNVIPKSHAARYGSAIVAAQSGQPLAASFLLRVFIEQYWLGIQAVSEAIKQFNRPTGDEIGQAYKDTLPADFKERFPTLCEIYSDLSAAMHTADERIEVYSTACAQIVEHFEARRLFRLDKA